MSIKNIEQYENNLGIMTSKELETIQQKKIMIVGLGGLGGHLADNLVRLGVSKLMLVDFDVFEVSNLNRQLYSTQHNIGDYKVHVLREQLQKINQDCLIEVSIEKIEDLLIENLRDIDYIVDAVDSPQTKIHIAELANKLKIPLVHGACAGWYGQVGIILPGCTLIKDVYQNQKHGIEMELLNPSFTPAAIAAIMVSEFVKYLNQKKSATINQLRLIDLLNAEFIGTGD